MPRFLLSLSVQLLRFNSCFVSWIVFSQEPDRVSRQGSGNKGLADDRIAGFEAEWLRAWDTVATMKLWRREVVSSASMAEWFKGAGHLGHDEAMEAGGREFSLHGGVVKGVGHLGHDEAT